MGHGLSWRIWRYRVNIFLLALSLAFRLGKFEPCRPTTVVSIYRTTDRKVQEVLYFQRSLLHSGQSPKSSRVCASADGYRVDRSTRTGTGTGSVLCPRGGLQTILTRQDISVTLVGFRLTYGEGVTSTHSQNPGLQNLRTEDTYFLASRRQRKKHAFTLSLSLCIPLWTSTMPLLRLILLRI
jgi:hypothetical protein